MRRPHGQGHAVAAKMAWRPNVEMGFVIDREA